MSAHEVIEEEIEARQLINQGEIIKSDSMLAKSAIRDVCPNARSVLFHVKDQILKLLFVNFEVLHHHVVTQAIALIKELNIVKQMLAVLFGSAVDFLAVKVERDGEEDCEASRGMNVATNVLVIKSDVPPGTGSLGPTDTHFSLLKY